MRAVILVVALSACGGSPKPAAPAPAPVAEAKPEPPPPAPDLPPAKPEAHDDQVARGGDPCEGGEATGVASLQGHPPLGSELGASGAGAGGGGTGETLGTGTIGTIGHGSGTGSSGVGRGGRTQIAPTAKLGEGTVKGDLDKAIIRRYLKRNIQKLAYCYEKTLLVKPKLAGTVTMTWDIDDQGKVSNAKATGVDKAIDECVTTVLESIEYPKPKSATVSAKFQITYSAPPP